MPAFIDEPGHDLDSATLRIVGWVAGNDPALPVSLFVNDRPVAFHRMDRPDLRQALPQFSTSFGIFQQMGVAQIVPAGDMDRFVVRLRAGDDEAVREVTIGTGIAERLRSQGAIRSETRNWIVDRLRCPICKAYDSRLHCEAAGLVCSRCLALYSQDGVEAIDLRSPALRASVMSDRTHNVSSNPYEVLAQQLIDRTIADGGWVLDCGAGSRPLRTRHVLNLEIEDYASTDVLSSGESLPFQDDTFDGAVSLAVLEHVRDPFACARELLRVVKPGCEIICSVPFLQPVHGFPSHYYNMTREGLKNLFEPGEIVDCLTPLNGHPILTLQWFASEYLRGLPDNERAVFGALTLAEAAALAFPEAFAAGYVTQLSAETTQTIACLNTIVVRKRR